MSVALVIAILVRVLLVALFLPFSALDKLLNFKGAVGQASEAIPLRAVAGAMVLAGLAVEVFCSLAILTGPFDRAAAVVLALYCAVTALLWKQFWRPGDFWRAPNGKARGLFWDFWKNLALGAGFLLLAFGSGAAGVEAFFAAPLASSHPYDMSIHP